MDTILLFDQASFLVEAVLAAVGVALSFFRAQKTKNGSLLYYLLTGFYACVFMSNAFFLLTWFITDYPFVFSPGDLSWLGAIVFLITIALDSMDKWTPAQKTAAKKFYLPALTAPLVCIAFNAVYINLYPELVVNYILYAIPIAILSFFSLWLFLAGRKQGNGYSLRRYNHVVLVWVAIQLVYDLFSTLNDDNVFVVHGIACSFLLSAATLAIYFAARKEAVS